MCILSPGCLGNNRQSPVQPQKQRQSPWPRQCSLKLRISRDTCPKSFAVKFLRFFRQDNSTVITILKAGYSQKLRHMPRVHRVNVASISERLAVSNVQIDYCPTKEQRANGFTKVITPQEWPSMLEQLCLSDGPASTMISAALSRQVATEPLESSDPESVASILPRRLQEQHILQLFHLLPSDELPHPVALTEGRSFATGAYASGDGMVGLRRNTIKLRGGYFCACAIRPSAEQRVVVHCRCHLPRHSFCTAF